MPGAPGRYGRLIIFGKATNPITDSITSPDGLLANTCSAMSCSNSSAGPCPAVGMLARSSAIASSLKCLRSGFEPSKKRVLPAEIQANAAEADRLYHQSYPRGTIPQCIFERRLVIGLPRLHLFKPTILASCAGFCFTQATARIRLPSPAPSNNTACPTDSSRTVGGPDASIHLPIAQ